MKKLKVRKSRKPYNGKNGVVKKTQQPVINLSIKERNKFAEYIKIKKAQK